ncbi:heme oxygenase 1a [Erpetoichthys calabaricus]|uniref:Heme oxygenase n=1 Tax=Erpetoichthys calabaricus TaxID=27687 RepID=A0A8C4SEJ8_ERPCA|nr:heme oxygenase 1a [Erpetoichthys calabaricus]
MEHQSEASGGMKQDLSESIKLATKEVHEIAENTEFMRSFQKGNVNLEEFKLVLSSLYHIYTALEEEIECNKSHPAFAPLYFPAELHRVAALEADLKYYYGNSWKSCISVPLATERYVARIHEVGKLHPELLVSHSYTRYLGDLSGGQVLKKIAQKALNLPPSGEGLAFFNFSNVSSAAKFKQLYRARMNTLEMNEETRQKVLQEAVEAFMLNVKVFEALQEISNASSKKKSDNKDLRQRQKHTNSEAKKTNHYKSSETSLSSPFPSLRLVFVTLFAVATVVIGIYIL